MIDLGSLDFHIDIPSVSKEELESYSSDLFDKWDAYLSEALNLPDFAISLEVEDGSISLRGKIFTALGTLYVGIGMYGSFVSGLKEIKNQATEAYSYLADVAHSPYKAEDGAYRATKRSGTLGKLERLFAKVERNEMTSEEAMNLAEAILGNEAENSPEFMKDLDDALQNLPRIPEQMNFEMELIEEEENQIPDKPAPKPKRSVPARTRLVPSLHNRVVVWKESKKGKKKIEVTQF